MTLISRSRCSVLACFVAVALLPIACGSDSGAPGTHNRSYLMGFSNFPPAPDTALQRRSVEMWNSRSDAAILHLDPPWEAMLNGIDPDVIVSVTILPLTNVYKSLGKQVVIETDLTNGVDRTAESPSLIALGHSITEDTVQRVYRRYAVSIAKLAAPAYLGLASETNLIRLASSPAVYAAVVRMSNDAAADIRNAGYATPLYVSAQVEVAWGRIGLGGATSFVGIDQDRTDFPFIDVLGLSSYPYLAGFADPSQVPADYFSRLAGTPPLRVLVTEGGWSSANIGVVHSSPALQAAWIDRAATLLDNAHALAWFQLQFTDINLVAFGLPADDPQVAPFARIGLVDTALTPKPALASWDGIFARPHVSISP
ncbi:MAG: hypothetical protein ABIQ10_13905 [Gemmatimonadaceae bacterium]